MFIIFLNWKINIFMFSLLILELNKHKCDSIFFLNLSNILWFFIFILNNFIPLKREQQNSKVRFIKRVLFSSVFPYSSFIFLLFGFMSYLLNILLILTRFFPINKYLMPLFEKKYKLK